MGKKLKKIKINKFWKSLFHNKPLVIFAAVLILAIVFTNKNISQYFKPEGSQAAGGASVSSEQKIELPADMTGAAIPSDIYGNRLVFTYIGGPSDPKGGFYLYDLDTNELKQLFAVGPYGSSAPPRIWGNNIIYAFSNLLIRYYIPTGEQTTLSSDVVINGNGQSQVDIYKNFVVAEVRNHDFEGSPTNIWLYNIQTGISKFISPNPRWQWKPRIGGHLITWSDDRNSHTSTDIYAYDLTNNQEKAICTAKNVQSYADNFGDNIVWVDYRNQNPTYTDDSDLYLYNYSTSKETLLSLHATPTIDTKGHMLPVIWDKYVFYEDNFDPGLVALADLAMINISTLKYTLLYKTAWPELNPVAWGDKNSIKLIWADGRDSVPPYHVKDMYMRTISLM